MLTGKDSFVGKMINKFFTREIITYVIAGILTTVINFAASYVMFNLLEIEENITTVSAAVISIIFAYFINNSWVFQKGNEGFKNEIKKIGAFFASRWFVLLVEEGCIFIFSTKLGFYYWIVKVPVSFLVIVLNYLFSKFIIFSRRLTERSRKNRI